MYNNVDLLVRDPAVIQIKQKTKKKNHWTVPYCLNKMKSSIEILSLKKLSSKDCF